MKNHLTHLAIIMDGNGRWAKQRGLSRKDGHKRGAEVIREITAFATKQDEIESLTLYAFSTENWKRARVEVEFLMKLLSTYLKQELEFYLKHSVRFKSIGDIGRFSPSLQKLIKKTEELTAKGSNLTQYLALNYGSCDEIVRAANSLVEQKIEIDEESLRGALDCALDIDLLIRTGGEQRLSNFLLYQCSYAELSFSKTLWPDFTTDELEQIIEEYRDRTRRFGGV